MRHFLFVLLLCFSLPGFGQTVINRSGAIHGESFVTPYDSLSNFRKFKHDDQEDYYHLIGQTALFLGNPYSNKSNPALVVGEEYKILDVLPDEKWNGALCYLKVKSTKTGKVVRVDPGTVDRMNISWVVNGYVNKLYALYSGKEYLYDGGSSYSHNNADYLVNCKTNTISKSIPAGTRWKFVEIQLLPRLKNDNMGLDDRCPVVFVMENEQYGRYYVYYEDLDGFGETGPFRSLFTVVKAPVDLSNIDCRIGMTEKEVRERIGEPIGTSKSVMIKNGKTEVINSLVFPGKIHVTVERGVVTDIEVK